eukprot:Nitzschia sp. Nitz4//scaffold45_size130396//122373//123149//NITZ4_003474-RA/size130396-processed-gene-0.203-mRNA-1//1//CDS//3329552473//733//frame0
MMNTPHSPNSPPLKEFMPGILSPLRVGGIRNGGLSRKVVEPLWENKMRVVSIDFDMAAIHVILVDTIKKYSKDEKLKCSARLLSNSLEGVGKRLGNVVVGGLDATANIIEAFLSSTPDLPPNVVAFVHTHMGMIRRRQDRLDDAIESLVKALWIRRSAGQAPELIAVACYQLGVTYRLAGKNTNAVATLRQSIQFYHKAGFSKDHDYIAAAQRQLFQVKTKYQGADVMKIPSPLLKSPYKTAAKPALAALQERAPMPF